MINIIPIFCEGCNTRFYEDEEIDFMRYSCGGCHHYIIMYEKTCDISYGGSLFTNEPVAVDIAIYDSNAKSTIHIIKSKLKIDLNRFISFNEYLSIVESYLVLA